MRYEKRHEFGILILASVGVLFSAYLTLPLLLFGTCPVSEGCHSVLGIPSCVLSLVFFLILLVMGLFLSQTRDARARLRSRSILLTFSMLGMLVLGFEALREIVSPFCLEQPCAYELIIPLCAYGLLLYGILFFFAHGLKKN